MNKELKDQKSVNKRMEDMGKKKRGEKKKEKQG